MELIVVQLASTVFQLYHVHLLNLLLVSAVSFTAQTALILGSLVVFYLTMTMQVFVTFSSNCVCPVGCSSTWCATTHGSNRSPL